MKLLRSLDYSRAGSDFAEGVKVEEEHHVGPDGGQKGVGEYTTPTLLVLRTLTPVDLVLDIQALVCRYFFLAL